MAEGEIRIRKAGDTSGATFVGSGPVPPGYELLGPASAPPPPSKTIRLQSVQDPSVIIEGPAGKPFDVRAWQPVGASRAPAVERPAPPARPSIGPLSDFADAASAVAGLPFNVPFSGAAPPPEVMREAPGAVLTSALPMAGAAIGGTLAGPAAPVGAAVGAAAGEGINQYVGITEPDANMILLNGVLPTAGHLLGKITNGMARYVGARLPGASSTLHEMAAEQLGKIPGAIQPKATAEGLYKIVDGFSPEIPMPNLRSTATKLLSQEEQAAAGLKLGSAETATSLRARATPVTKSVDTGVVDAKGNPITRTVTENPGGAMPFQDIRVNLRRVGDKIRELRESGGEELGAYKQLYHAMMNDMEAATAAGNPALPAVQALKAANTAMKREFAAEELGNLFSIKGGGIAPRPGGAGIEVNFGKIVREIEKSDDLRRSLTMVKPDGRTEYETLLADVREMWKKTPALPKAKGVEGGSKLRVTSIALGGGVGGAVGNAFGNTALGTSLGLAAGAAGPVILGDLMVSEGGRRFLAGVLSGTGGVINPQTMSILAVAAGNTPPARDTAAQLSDLGRQYMSTGRE